MHHLPVMYMCSNNPLGKYLNGSPKIFYKISQFQGIDWIDICIGRGGLCHLGF